MVYTPVMTSGTFNSGDLLEEIDAGQLRPMTQGKINIYEQIFRFCALWIVFRKLIKSYICEDVVQGRCAGAALLSLRWWALTDRRQVSNHTVRAGGC